MSLKEQINNDIVVAMRNKDNAKRDVLRVLKGEMERSEAKTQDTQVSIVKKMIENIKLTDPQSIEIGILEVYLPQQLSEDAIRNLIQNQIEVHGYTTPKDMGSLMNYFKENYNGQYDGKMVSTLIRGQLSN